MRWVASQLSVPATGFMCSDQRQPGSQEPAIAEWSPIFTICTSPLPDIERRSSGCCAFLISSPAICPSALVGVPPILSQSAHAIPARRKPTRRLSGWVPRATLSLVGLEELEREREPGEPVLELELLHVRADGGLGGGQLVLGNADEAQLCFVHDRVFGHLDLDLTCCPADVCEARALQDVGGSVGVGERERAGRALARSGCRRWRRELGHGCREEPGIAFHRLPAGEGDPAAGPQLSSDVAKRRSRLV